MVHKPPYGDASTAVVTGGFWTAIAMDVSLASVVFAIPLDNRTLLVLAALHPSCGY